MSQRNETILVRSPNWIGDAVVATAILGPLRKHNPEKRIGVVAKGYVAPVFDHNPSIDSVTIFRGFADGIRTISGESGIVLPNSFSSALLFTVSGVKQRIGYRAECRSFLLTEAVPQQKLREEHLVENYKRLALRLIANGGGEGFEPAIYLSTDETAMDPFEHLPIPHGSGPVVIDPGSAYGEAKEWQEEKYAKIIDYLSEERNIPVVLLGSSGAMRIASRIAAICRHEPYQLTGKLSLRQAIVAISKSRLFLSPDTGGMHIAAALMKPQVAIFGSSTPIWTGPLNPRSRVVYKNLECSPCFKRRCPLNTFACLREIAVEEVLGQIEELL